jgi:hypothetical protein
MHAISQSKYLKLVRASAWYDVAVTTLFATPWTFKLVHEATSRLNQILGGAALAAFGPLETMIANMMGTVVLLWSILRQVEPTVRLGRFDGTGRFLFSAWMAWALAATGAPVLWLFLAPEFAWGLIQWWPVAGLAAAGKGCPAGRQAASLP